MPPQYEKNKIQILIIPHVVDTNIHMSPTLFCFFFALKICYELLYLTYEIFFFWRPHGICQLQKTCTDNETIVQNSIYLFFDSEFKFEIFN